MKKIIFLFVATMLLFASCGSETEADRTISVTGVAITENNLSLYVGATVTLTATVRPSDADNQRVTWSSSNTSVATINNGTVTAIAGGTTTITVTTQDGNFTATITITVNIPTVSVTSVTLTGCDTDIPLIIGDTRQLTATVLPENATNTAVTWSSSSPNVATVVNGLVTAVTAGTATITVTTEDGTHTATCEITVNVPTVSVTGVTLTGCDTDTPLEIGSTRQLTATVLPENATNTAVTWLSSNPNVATVVNGLVTAVTAGTTTITVTTEDGERTAICAITVRPISPGIGEPTLTTDPGVVINNIRWATRNVNAPGTFTNNPQDAGMHFQWNRIRGWSTTNPLRHWANNDWVAGGWNSSIPGGTTWYVENDPCPPGWRVPTIQELSSLRSAGSTWTTINSVNGRLYGTAPNQLFLPAAGRRSSNGALNYVGTNGNYWSSTQSDSTNAWSLWLSSSNSGVNAHTRRTGGFSVRCVSE